VGWLCLLASVQVLVIPRPASGPLPSSQPDPVLSELVQPVVRSN
jgi:hypothetical protein